ncbi:MAG: response regulator [Elainellaceae cyanobacterium]
MSHPSMLQLQQYFAEVRNLQFTGALRARSPYGETWDLYYLLGRLIWASGGRHRLRRWQRLLAPHVENFSPNWVVIRQQHLAELWEYRVLLALIKRQQIQQEQAVQLIRQGVAEVLFDILLDGAQFELDSSAAGPVKQLGKVLVFLNAEEQLRDGRREWENWNQLGFEQLSPNKAPTITDLATFQKHVSPETYAKVTKIVDGKVTLRELSARIGVHLPSLTRSLMPFIHRGLLLLKDVPDLGLVAADTNDSQVAVPASTGDRAPAPTIACIDDSPLIGRNMQAILSRAGYQCICIQDPLESILTLIETRPQLIFLDLVMPVANGYEICAQIRRISTLKAIPVIILTGNDGIVDRVRAKLVGASDFMTKPVQADKVLAVVQRYLAQTPRPPTLPESLASTSL